MENHSSASTDHRLIWIYPDNLLKKLNSAPTLQTTRGLRQAGWQVDLLMGGVDGVREIQGVKVTGIPRPDTFVVKQFVYHARALKYVLDHWNTTSIVFFLSISAPWILLLRIIGWFKPGKRPLFVMDTRTMQMEKKTMRDKLHGLFTGLMNWLANWFADGQTAITRRMAEAYHIPAKKLWGTWPSGVDLASFSHVAGSRYWPLGDEPVQLVYIGTLAPGRGLLALARAVEKTNQEGACIELTFVGDGPDRESLTEFAAHTEGRVRLLGRLPHEQIPGVLEGMHVGALPFPDEQEFRVSSPIKLFEYMGAGMPVLATRIPCHTDIIGDQPCAFWAENSSVEGLSAALHHLWENRRSLASRGSLAAGLAQGYTWAASSKKLAAALEYGLAKQRRQPA